MIGPKLSERLKIGGMSYKPTTEVDAWVQLWDRARVGVAISIDMVNLHLLTFFLLCRPPYRCENVLNKKIEHSNY